MEQTKEHGFTNMIKNGLSSISRAVSASVFPPIAEGTKRVMKNIDDGMIQMEKRIFRKIFSLLIIWFGGVFLIFALFFFLIDSLNWSNAAVFFSIGIVIFVIGLLLKIGESNR